MPNWVYNDILIKDLDENSYKKFKDNYFDGEDNFTFQKIIPRPAEFDKGDSWYDWNISNWGCKWDSSNTVVEYKNSEKELNLYFNTPWSPPIPVILNLSKKIKQNIKLTYNEEQGWGGIIDFKSGTLTEGESWDIPESHADLVNRKQECYCLSSDEVFYEDCFYERAKLIPGLSGKEIEFIKSLGSQWQGNFEEILIAAKKI